LNNRNIYLLAIYREILAFINTEDSVSIG